MQTTSIRKVVRIVVLLSLATLMTQCKTAAADSEDTEVNSNCFTQLFPQRIINNQIAVLAFQNGQCWGEMRAINKSSLQRTVLVSQDGLGLTAAAESILSIQNDGIVMANSSVGVKRIGRIDPGTFTIALEPGVEFALMMSDSSGVAQQWSLGSQGPINPVQENIVINVPY